MKRLTLARVLALLVLTSLLAFSELAAQCPVGWSLTSNRTRLYLYFASAADATFPEYYTAEVETAPLDPFNVADLSNTIGTTAQLRDRISDIVREDYCEFDVEIIPTTTAPTTTGAQWQVVGLGTDEETDAGSSLFGVAQDVDLNNADPQDFSRVFARSFFVSYGGAGGALNGANSTLERWATAIGHTTSHEAGHNFGLSHSDSASRPGEDEQNWHIMATGNTGLTGEMRAARNRHFGDREYEILGHNIGLRVKTLYNWDFINPNAENANSLVLTLLSPAPSLTLNWFYNGTASPWTNPTVAAAGTQSFQGTTYNKFTLTFSSPKAWSGGANGVVPGGAEFHVGATFAQSDLVIVYETRLRDSGNNNLGLHPRLVGFDAGSADLDTGDFNIRAFNPEAGVNLVIEDLRVVMLPRMASIETMLPGVEPRDVRDVPVAVRPPGRSFAGQRNLEVRDATTFRLANLKDARFVDEFYDGKNCQKGRKGGGTTTGQTPSQSPGQSPGQSPTRAPAGPGDVEQGEIDYCPNGWALSLFPSTYVYLTATVVEPNAKFWDRAQAKYVTGPLRSKVFYQFSGIVPDLNKNGVDDLIDIRTNVSQDGNGNGVVDEAERGRERQGTTSTKGEWYKRWWWLILLILLLIILLIWLLKRRKPRPTV